MFNKQMSGILKNILFILTFIYPWPNLFALNVKIRENHNVKVEPLNTRVHKRDMTQFFDKASYSFDGLEKVESVPVHFPLDICIMNLEGVKYAASLHINKKGLRYFAVFKMQRANYVQLADIPTPIAIAMDCRAMGAKGYVALTYNITTPIEKAQQGSPIYEITGVRLRAIQYFAATNLASMYLSVTGNDFFLLQNFANIQATPNLRCPYFIWSGSTFNKAGHIPCTNARHLEPFAIDYESYVAVANYADKHGRTAINSEIYKYVREQKKFQLFQKIKTNGAVDVRYFSVLMDEVKTRHFLIFGNTASDKSTTASKQDQLEADSIFYVYENGQFVPYQRLSFYAVEQFLPVQNTEAEKFLLLVACNNQDIKIYNLNDWKFEESLTQFTEGALGRGVASMRIYQEQDQSYLVIANELMHDNETNVFKPIFKQDKHANALRQQIIDWAKTQIDRISRIDVEKLRKQVADKMAKQQHKNLSVNITNIVNCNAQTAITKTLLYPRLHMTTSYWKALSYAHQALDALQAQFGRRKREKRALLSKDPVTAYKSLKVGTLLVREALQAPRVNGIEVARPRLDRLSAQEVIVTGSYNDATASANATEESVQLRDANSNAEDTSETIEVVNLQVSGKLNEYTWGNLERNALRRTGQQFLKAPASITSLRAETVQVTNNEMNELNLAQLIPINGSGKYVVQQDLQFAAPITAKNVMINERLNNIHVYRNKLDVLLKRSNVTQVVEGAKTFENIRVLEPITIAGRMLGRQLELISPSKVIEKDLTLSGDFIISGDVTITQALRAFDLIEANSNVSTKDTLQAGLRLDRPLEDVNLRFTEPLEANSSLVSFINARDLQHLVKTNTNEIQTVEGAKIFRNSLEIHNGFSEVKHLNGHNIEELEKRLLLKTTNQTITAPMHIGKVITKGVRAKTLTLGGKNLTDFLTKSTSQEIKGELKLQKLTTQTLELENLNTNGKIFNTSLSAIYQQKTKSAPRPEILQRQRKFYGSMFVKNLCINSTINGEKVSKIERQLELLHGDIKYVGNFKFNYEMNITNLTFHGNMNGIAAKDFGHCWLQKSGAQVFVAPQTLAEVQCESNVLLQGKLNGHRLEDFWYDAVWVNRPEHIANAIFENPTNMQGVLKSRTINSLYIPQDILYLSSSKPQVLECNVVVEENLFVNGDILNTSTVNGINLHGFEQYLNGFNYDILHVEHAHFKKAPYYKTINQHDLEQTLNTVWLANENLDLQQDVEISEGVFEGLVHLEGPINNINLKYLQENYFSLTRPQEVVAEISFNEVTFENEVNMKNLFVNGAILDTKSKLQFNFDEFVSNTLKTAGPHKISGAWSLAAARIWGDLRGIRVNGLNLAQDVLRLDVSNAEITAPKYVASATIKQLYTTPGSTVNEVHMADWIRDAVYIYENHTIRGNTTIDHINVVNDLRVQGLVNNLTFNDRTLLLRSRHGQVLHGNVEVHNKIPEQELILANNFEYLQTEQFNDLEVRRFFSNQAKQGAPAALQVHSHLVFTQPLLVQEYHGADSAYNAMKLKRGVVGNETFENWNALHDSVKSLQSSFEASYFVFDHFEVRQTLHINATQIIPLSLKMEQEFTDIIGIINQSDSGEFVYFARWDLQTQQFISDSCEY